MNLTKDDLSQLPIGQEVAPGWWKSRVPSMLKPGADQFFQKTFYINDEDKIAFNVYQYDFPDMSRWELDTQIDERISVTGKTINTLNFSYLTLDFSEMEKDGYITVLSLVDPTKIDYEKLSEEARGFAHIFLPLNFPRVVDK